MLSKKAGNNFKAKKILIIGCATVVVLVIIGIITFLINQNVNIMEQSSSNANYVSLEEGFTDVKVTDELSAIKAVKSVADVLGLSGTKDEVKVISSNNIDGTSYYRMQQYYNDIPVYGRTVVIAAGEDGNASLLTANTCAYNKPLDEVVRNADEYVAQAKKLIAYDKILDSKICEKVYVPKGTKDIILCYPVEITYSYNNQLYSKIIYISSYDLSAIKENDLIDNNIFISGISGTKKTYDSIALSGEKSNNNYLLVDDERNIICGYISDGVDKVTDSISNTSNKECVDAYVNMQKVYDYFNGVLEIDSFENNRGTILLISKNGYLYDQAKSAPIDTLKKAISIGSEKFLNYGVILLGEPNQYLKSSLVNAIDIIAHEYTHRLIESIVMLDNSGIEEGICDIFGNLAELENNSSSDVWELGENAGYSKYDMSDSVTMSSYDDNDDGHDNAAIIAHAAYLMWNGIDGTAAQKINTQTLVKLWYQSLHIMHADATFNQCADAVIKVANQMKKQGVLTEEQYICVKTAFAEVGIESKIVESGSILIVYDKNRKAYDNYHISIKSLFDDSKVIVDEDVNHLDGFVLDLEAGSYIITITDNKEESTSIYTKQIGIVPSLRHNYKEVDVFTDYEPEIDPELLYREYLGDVLVPQYGIFEKEQTGIMHDMDDKWLNIDGIMGTKILDFDMDGELELLVCYTTPSEMGNDYRTITMDMYEIKEEKVVLVDSMKLSTFVMEHTYDPAVELSASEWCELAIHVNAIWIHNNYYIMCENNSVAGYFADGHSQDYWIIQYQEETFQYVASFTQTDGGSSGFEFTGYEFTNGMLTNAKLFYNEGYFEDPTLEEKAPYENFDDAIISFFQQYDVLLNKEEVTSDARYNSFKSILSDKNKIIRIFGFENQVIGYEDFSGPFQFKATLTADGV